MKDQRTEVEKTQMGDGKRQTDSRIWSEEEKRGRPWRGEKWKKTRTEAQREKGKRDVVRKRERVRDRDQGLWKEHQGR